MSSASVESVSCEFALPLRSLKIAVPLYADWPCRLAFCASPPGGKRLQAAHVERIDRDVCFHRGGRRGAQRGLIVDAGLRDSVAEIDDRFFLRDFPERLHQRLECEKFSIGGEGVVIGVVGREGAAGFGCAFGRTFGACVVALALAGTVGAQRREDFLLVVGEIEIDMHVRRERNERDHVGREHFFFDEFCGGIHAAIDLLGIHAAEIEEQEDEAAVARIDLNGVRGVEQASVRCVTSGAGDGGIGCARGGECVDVFKIEGGDVLFFAVFGEGEVGLFQIADQIAVAVAGDDVDEDEFGGDVHAVLRLLWWLGASWARNGNTTLAAARNAIRTAENFVRPPDCRELRIRSGTSRLGLRGGSRRRR